jgi:hypothetical protein
MAINGVYQVSELDYGDKDFSELVAEIEQRVNNGDAVLCGSEQLDTMMVILEMNEDDTDAVNEGLTFAIRGVGREGFEKSFDEKLKEMSEEMVRSYEEEKA